MGSPEQAKVNEGILRIHRETGIPIVLTNDTHYLRKEDHRMQNVLICIKPTTQSTMGNDGISGPRSSISKAAMRWRRCCRL